MAENQEDRNEHLSSRRLREIALNQILPTPPEMTHLDDCAECAQFVVLFSHHNGNRPKD
jgi:hypothetical protein